MARAGRKRKVVMIMQERSILGTAESPLIPRFARRFRQHACTCLQLRRQLNVVIVILITCNCVLDGQKKVFPGSASEKVHRGEGWRQCTDKLIDGSDLMYTPCLLLWVLGWPQQP